MICYSGGVLRDVIVDSILKFERKFGIRPTYIILREGDAASVKGLGVTVKTRTDVTPAHFHLGPVIRRTPRVYRNERMPIRA